MRIAFVVTNFPSMSQTFVLTQIVELVKRGYQVDIFPRRKREFDDTHGDIERYGLLRRVKFPTIRPEQPLERLAMAGRILREADQHGRRILLRTLDVRRFGARAVTLKQFFEVLPFLGSASYDVVHCHFGPSALRALRASSVGALHGPLVTSFHGYDALALPAVRAKAVYRELFESCRVFTANTSFLAGRLAELGCPPDRTVVLHSAHAIADPPNRQRVFRPGETVELVTVARLVEVKGIQHAIQAVVRLHRRFPNLRYRIVGDGPLRGQLQQEIERAGASYIELLGWRAQEQLREIYESSHIFILPSIVDSQGAVEAQGVVLQEAQAMGLPVIASRVGGIPEGVLDGESAVLVPPGDAVALASAIEELIENSDRWPDMGRAGKRFAEERFGLRALTEQLIAIYSRAARGTLPGTAPAAVAAEYQLA